MSVRFKSMTEMTAAGQLEIEPYAVLEFSAVTWC